MHCLSRAEPSSSHVSCPHRHAERRRRFDVMPPQGREQEDIALFQQHLACRRRAVVKRREPPRAPGARFVQVDSGSAVERMALRVRVQAVERGRREEHDVLGPPQLAEEAAGRVEVEWRDGSARRDPQPHRLRAPRSAPPAPFGRDLPLSLQELGHVGLHVDPLTVAVEKGRWHGGSSASPARTRAIRRARTPAASKPRNKLAGAHVRDQARGGRQLPVVDHRVLVSAEDNGWTIRDAHRSRGHERRHGDGIPARGTEICPARQLCGRASKYDRPPSRPRELSRDPPTPVRVRSCRRAPAGPVACTGRVQPSQTGHFGQGRQLQLGQRVRHQPAFGGGHQ
eukprot:scaffold18613_cov112-Isochrysis_galbana.AAC.4